MEFRRPCPKCGLHSGPDFRLECTCAEKENARLTAENERLKESTKLKNNQSIWFDAKKKECRDLQIDSLLGKVEYLKALLREAEYWVDDHGCDPDCDCKVCKLLARIKKAVGEGE